MFKKREQSLRFYDRENMPYLADRQRIAELGKWLSPVNWQVFCTFTFGWRASDPEAVEAFHGYIDNIERFIKSDIIYVRGDEKRFSGCGKSACGRHFHAVMASAAPLSLSILSSFWNSIGKQDDAALVEPYNPNLDGVGYVLKFINQQHGDWNFGKLHLALPGYDATSHQKRRNLQRHRARLKAYANHKPYQLSPGGPNPTSSGQFMMFGQQFDWKNPHKPI